MIRQSWKPLLFGTVVVLAVSTMASSANACWRCYQPVGYAYAPCYTWYYAPCYSTCYTPCYSPCAVSCGSYGSNWYLGYRPGPVRRLLLGPYRGYYGGSYAGYCGTYTGCYDTLACCGSTTTGAPATQGPQPTPAKKPVIEPPTAPAPAMPSLTEPPAMPSPTTPAAPATPVVPPIPGTPAPAAPVAPLAPGTPGSTAIPSSETSGSLTVWVPYDAKVTINGMQTKSTGSRRQFISYGLKPGFSYKYEVRAQVVRDGQLVEDVKTVSMTAGEITAVAFGFNVLPTEGLATAN